MQAKFYDIDETILLPNLCQIIIQVALVKNLCVLYLRVKWSFYFLAKIGAVIHEKTW